MRVHVNNVVLTISILSLFFSIFSLYTIYKNKQRVYYIVAGAKGGAYIFDAKDNSTYFVTPNYIERVGKIGRVKEMGDAKKLIESSAIYDNKFGRFNVLIYNGSWYTITRVIIFVKSKQSVKLYMKDKIIIPPFSTKEVSFSMNRKHLSGPFKWGFTKIYGIEHPEIAGVAMDAAVADLFKN